MENFSAKISVQSVKVRLRKRRGRGWAYEVIEIPTDAEMERIATGLHARHVPAQTDCLGWKVLYIPAASFSYTMKPVNVFTGERGIPKEARHSKSISTCVFGHGSQWQVCYAWNQGDDKSPARIQENGDVVPLPELLQGDVFSENFGASGGILEREEFFEGTVKRAELSKYERSRKARAACIEQYGTTCYVCGFDFSKVYGEIAKGFIHVHHLASIATIGGKHSVDPESDLRPVCPNCHAVLHMRTPPLRVEELRKVMGHLPVE
jgi:hypothetical protein